MKQLVNGMQLDIFELLPILSAEQKSRRKKLKVVRNDSPCESEKKEDYLEKGVLIESLARDRFQKTIKDLNFSTLEEKVYAVPYNSAETLYKNVERIARVFRSYVSDMDLSKDSEDIKALKALIDLDIEMERVDSDAVKVGAVRRLTYRMKKNNDIVFLTIKEPGWPSVFVYGYRQLNSGKQAYLMTDHTCVADIGLVLAWLFVITLYNRSIKDPTMAGAIKQAFSLWTEGSDGDFLNCLYRYNGYYRLKESKDGRYLTSKEVFQRSRLFLPQKCHQRLREEVLDELSGLFGLSGKDIPVSHLKRNILQDKNSEAYRGSGNTSIYGWELSCGLEYGIVSLDPVKYFSMGFGELSYNQTLSRAGQLDNGEPEYIPPAWPLPSTAQSHAFDSAYPLVKEVMKAVWAEKSQVVSKVKYYRDMMSDKSVAKAYQTKKAIPQKTLKEMENSDFNKYFGYVEIDESCDLDKVRSLADEFSGFKEKYLPGFDSSGVSLRFRHIGNHKASGLYYPMVGCLVVDVNSPDSFIHEYGHCLDNLVNGKYPLSDLSGFYEVYLIYKECLINALQADMKEYKKMRTSKSKYNLSYYLLHTEAFARCFEIYVTRVLGFETSLCKKDTKLGWAYPVSEKLTQAVKEYFDCLLVTVNGTDAEEASAA